jgi:L-lactate utilization protein LutB
LWQCGPSFRNFEAERGSARRIKHEAIGRLDELLIQLKERLEANGCKIFVAADARMAAITFLSLARARGVKRAV